jgi:hypothetical protein
MSTLGRALRKRLETTIREARDVAEKGAADAIRRLGVADDSAPTYLSDEQKALRVRLRAHARTLGDGWDGAQKCLLTTAQLQEAVAYEAWHRMLFGRFLVERGLLIHPEMGVAIGRDELRELAQEEGLPDEWALVERLAAPALPAVFRPDDPVLAVALAPEFAKGLRALVVGLPEEVFAAEDSLGWTYQFWRAAEKDAVNRVGGKIGAIELPAVTQLFTEPYMVKFLLHNTLGAWWAGKVLADNPGLARDAADEHALREACATGLEGVAWEFLRFVRDGDGTGSWRPAAGIFPDWPPRAAEITFMDPCCGSGHFLVEAFGLLAALRRAEEGLSGEEAAQALLRDNLHGLEIDGRCVQIAAFNVALAAWRLAGGPVALPQPHIAWVGAQPPPRGEMAVLAGGDTALHRALEALHDQFAQAPLLGSLLEVGAGDLLDADLRERGDAALARLREVEPERAEGVVAARGLLDATALLARSYVLQATNVPFLGRGKQDPMLARFIERQTPEAKADLSTAMLLRMRRMAAHGGAVASVTPQNWLFLGTYSEFRIPLLSTAQIAMLVDLGPAAFVEMNWWVARTALITLVENRPDRTYAYAAIDADTGRDLDAKYVALKSSALKLLPQAEQARNPDARITVRPAIKGELLARYATGLQGVSPADFPRFGRCFWEGWRSTHFAYWQSTFDETIAYGGRELVLDRGPSLDAAVEAGQAFVRGTDAWGKRGVVVRQMRHLPVGLYTGEVFDTNVAVIIPYDDEHTAAIWAYCSSSEYAAAVRGIDQKVNVTNATLVKVPFDLEHWQAVAAERYPNGLPEPYSDDPTQWLFHGHPAYSNCGTELHVALARLAGYRWPAETDAAMGVSSLARERIASTSGLPSADPDGLLPLHATAQDRPLADRLRDLLTTAFGDEWSNVREQTLVRAADALLDKKEFRDPTLEGWLRNRAFRQHCVLFHQRPFLWQVWDGGKDGFSAFLHYHRLDRATLEKLTYTVLGDWTARMKAEGRTAEEGSALQLRQRLVAILDGEKPYDIFVRWKPPGRQPVGWEPDLDDGVRLNIRPFIIANVLREVPKGINWNKDRGTDVGSAPWFHLGPLVKDKDGKPGKPGDRINDHHLTLADKRAARQKAAE